MCGLDAIGIGTYDMVESIMCAALVEDLVGLGVLDNISINRERFGDVIIICEFMYRKEVVS